MTLILLKLHFTNEFFVFRDRVCLCNRPSCPRTSSIYKADSDSQRSASWVLRLKANTTTAQFTTNILTASLQLRGWWGVGSNKNAIMCSLALTFVSEEKRLCQCCPSWSQMSELKRASSLQIEPLTPLASETIAYTTAPVLRPSVCLKKLSLLFVTI